ncbi:MAG: tyrosine-type recombinase/integrase, partial [Nitrososphaeraceae archaeon]
PRVQQFLSSKERGSVYYNLGYKTSLAYLFQFLNAKYNNLTLETIIDSIKPGNIDVYRFLDEFVTYLSQPKSLSQSTINQYLTCIKSYFQYHDVDIVPYKFKKRVVLPKIPREDEAAIDQKDIRTILLQCHNRRLKTYLLVLASSGVRATEACAIRVRDCNFDESPTKLHVRAEYTKTKRSRDVYISDEASRYLKEWIEYRFRIDLNKAKRLDEKIGDCLSFQVHDVKKRNITPRSIYVKLLLQFHTVLDAVDFGQRKDNISRRRKITLHSFRRFVKTTISDTLAGSDYSEWFLGHTKSSYYVSKPAVRAEIYANKCMKYLTFLEYSTLEATGKTNEARINELEKEKQIMSQKHEQEIQELREQTDHKLNEIIMMIQKNPKLVHLKQDVLMTRPLNRRTKL